MNLEEIEKLVRPNIRSLMPYSTARDDFNGELGVFLDANESPYNNGWNRYPDPHQKKLKAVLANIKGISVDNLFLGNGSDEAIDIVFRIFCIPSKDNIVAIAPSYGMYTVTAEINDIQVRQVLLNDDFSLSVDALLSACDQNTKAIFICSPNNPSGNVFGREDIICLLKNFHGMLVVDEAYIDFASVDSLKSEINNYPNLIILQTCSKARGLAALRLGLAISNEYVIRLMSRVKYPYNISESTQKIALDMLSRPIDDEVSEIKLEREKLVEILPGFKSVKKVYPSEANFLLVEVDDANRMYDFLVSRGIIVRNRTNAPLCKNCLRITIGLENENKQLIQALREYEESYFC